MRSPDLAARSDEAIAAHREALAVLPSGEPEAIRVGHDLATLLAIRFVRICGDPADRDLAIDLYEDHLADSAKDDTDTRIAGVWVGILLMFRVMRLPMPMTGDGVPDPYMFVSAAQGLDFGPESSADTARAAEVLGRFASSEELEPEIAQIAASMRALAVLFQAVNGPQDDPRHMNEAVRELGEVAADLDEDAPGYREMIGVHAYLQADIDRTEGPRNLDAVTDLRNATALFSPGDLLHSALQIELGIAEAGEAMWSGGRDGLVAASRRIEDAHQDMVDRGGVHPLYDESIRQLAGVLLSSTAFRPEPQDVERIAALIEQVRARREEDDRSGRAKDTYMLGMTGILRSVLTGREDDSAQANRLLEESLRDIDPSDPFALTMAVTYGSTLIDRHSRWGGLVEAQEAEVLLVRAETIFRAHMEAGTGDERELLLCRSMLGTSRLALAWRRRDTHAIDLAVDDLQVAVDGLPDDYPMRSQLLLQLGKARLMRSALASDMTEARAGLAALHTAVDLAAIDTSNLGTLGYLGGLAQAMGGILQVESDPEDGAVLLDQGARTLARLCDEGEHLYGMRSRPLWALGFVHLVQHDLCADPDGLELAIARFEQARGSLRDEPGSPIAADLLWALAAAYRRRGGRNDTDRAISTGMAALRARSADVLLQAGAEHGLEVARGAAENAQGLARWCAAEGRAGDALLALELGRGLVLHAATSATRIGERLRLDGFGELADEWESFQPTERLVPEGGPDRAWVPLVPELMAELQPPSDLRQRVLTALNRAGALDELMRPPSFPDMGDALRTAGADLIAYLLGGTEDEPGLILAVGADGIPMSATAPSLTADAVPLTAYAAHLGKDAGYDADWREALTEVCGWAWTAAIEPLLELSGDGDGPPRIVLVPGGLLGSVPWQAARAADGRYACQEIVLSYAASARQFMAAGGRRRRPLLESPVLVSDPVGELDTAVALTLVLRNLVYRDARVLGRTDDGPVRAPATPEAVRAAFALASMLQINCHAYTADSPAASCIGLADGDGRKRELRVTEIVEAAHGVPADAAGALVVLATCVSDLTAESYDEALTLATAFLTAGAAGVFGTRWAVSGRVTPLFMYVLHRGLVEGLDPVDALRSAQLWMIDPGRDVPAELPEAFRGDAVAEDLADPASWAGVTYQGA